MNNFFATAVLACAFVSAASANELQSLFEEDQADRAPGKPLDWETIGVRDEAREQRVKELLRAGSLQSGADYYHAAMILQHATEPDDYLLAHDLCVIAIGKGEQRAKWLAAASLDRFLGAIGRPQRFGTQFVSKRSFHPPRLAPVDPNVPDQLRRELNVPTLAEAKVKETQMIKAFEDRRRTPTDGRQDAFQETLTAHVNAVRNRDLDALIKTITAGDNLTLIFPNGKTTHTRQAYIDFHREWFAEQGWTMQMEPVSVQSSDELRVALMRTTYTDASGSRQGLLALTFAREQGQWRLVFDQNTRLADK
jgi:ketosteroid isomerase-like protein